MANRYGTDPVRLKNQKDIIEHIKDLTERVSSGETSLQAGHTAVEDGNFTVRNGDIIVSETEGDIVLRIKHGTVPEIRMWPLGETDTHRIAMFGYDDVNGGQAAAFVVETDAAVQDGGKILLSRGFAIISHQPDGEEESYVWLGGDPTLDEVIIVRGLFNNQIQYDDHQAIYAGSFVATSGFSTWTHTYFTPFATAMIPVLTVHHNGSTIEWNLDAFSTSSFTVRFSSTVNNKTINFWAFRTS